MNDVTFEDRIIPRKKRKKPDMSTKKYDNPYQY